MAGKEAAETEEQAAERKPGERVVLKMDRVIVVPEGVDPEKLAEVVKLLFPAERRWQKTPEAALTEAWVVVAKIEAPSKQKAIEAYAGKAGTPDAKQGVFRAPSLMAWKDGIELKAPPAPLVQRTSVD